MSRQELVSPEGFRLDGRKSKEIRQIKCKMGTFSVPSGSAYFKIGNSEVLAAVYGPHQIRGRRSREKNDKAIINCQYSMATFSTTERKRRPRGDRKSLEMTYNLTQAFESAIVTQNYANSQIDIFVEVLQSDGGNYSACINAATLALIDAGVCIKEFVCACTVGLWNDIPLIDLSYLEESSGCPYVTVALMPKSGEIVLFEKSCRLHIDHLEMLIDQAIKGCQDIFNILDKAVVKHISEINPSKVIS